MFFSSRKLISAGALALLGTGIFGCGMKFGQPPQNTTVMTMGDADAACLSGASKTLGDYFRGSTTDRQVSDAFGCASNALQLFEQRTRGAQVGQYSPDELRGFLQTYFLKGFTISDGLLSQLSLIKQALVGGSSTELTVKELDRIRGILDTLKDQSIRLRPFLPLVPSHIDTLSDQDLDTAISTMQDAAKAVGKILEGNASPYSFDSMNTLLLELEAFVQDPEEKADVEMARQYLPLFRQLKLIFISPDSDQMVGRDWQRLLKVGADFYALALRYSHTLANQPSLISGAGREQLAAESSTFFDLFEDVISRNPMQTVSFCNLYALIDELSSPQILGHQQDLQDLIANDFQGYPINLRPILDPRMAGIMAARKAKSPDNVSDPKDYLVYFQVGKYRIYRGSVKKFLEPLIQTVMKPQNDPSGKYSSPNGTRFPYISACQIDVYNQSLGLRYRDLGLTIGNVETLRQLIDYVSEGQNFLQKIFEWAGKNAGDSPSVAIGNEYRPEELMSWSTINELFGNVPFNGTTDLVASLSDIVSSHRPLFKGDDPMIKFTSSRDTSQNFVGLTWLNAIHQLVRTVWMGYTNPNDADPSTGQKEVWDAPHGGLLANKIEEFYEDTKEIGVAVDLYDPNAVSVAQERFLESNLFTYAADGNQFMSLGEATDLVAFLFSAKELSTRTYNKVHDLCALDQMGCPTGSPTTKDGKPWSCNIGPLDVYGADKISAQCYYKYAFTDAHAPPDAMTASSPSASSAPDSDPSSVGFVAVWDHMPDLITYYSSLESVDPSKFDSGKIYRKTFRCLLEQVARPVGADPAWYDSGDFDQMSALYHYLEGIYVRFGSDSDPKAKDQFIDQDGAMLAYPVLAYELRSKITSPEPDGYGITYLSSDSDFQAVLNYLLAGGQIPEPFDWLSFHTWGNVIDLGFRRYIHSFDYQADRARVLQVMALITDRDAHVCFLPDDQRIQLLQQKNQQRRAARKAAFEQENSIKLTQ